MTKKELEQAFKEFFECVDRILKIPDECIKQDLEKGRCNVK